MKNSITISTMQLQIKIQVQNVPLSVQSESRLIMGQMGQEYDCWLVRDMGDVLTSVPTDRQKDKINCLFKLNLFKLNLFWPLNQTRSWKTLKCPVQLRGTALLGDISLRVHHFKLNTYSKYWIELIFYYSGCCCFNDNHCNDDTILIMNPDH